MPSVKRSANKRSPKRSNKRSNKRSPKLGERQFYCVSCRTRRTLPKENISMKMYSNKVRGTIPAMRGVCPSCDTKLTKFVSNDKADKLVEKYGKSKK